MKKKNCFLLLAVLCTATLCLAGCGGQKDVLAGKTADEALAAVTATMAAERYKHVTTTSSVTLRGTRTENVTETDFARNADDPVFRIVKTGPVSGIDTRIEYLYTGGTLYSSTEMPSGGDLLTARDTTFENAYTIAGKCGEVNFALLFEGAAMEKKDGKYVFRQDAENGDLAEKLGLREMRVAELFMTVAPDGFCEQVVLRIEGPDASAETTYAFSRLPRNLHVSPPANAAEYEKIN